MSRPFAPARFSRPLLKAWRLTYGLPARWDWAPSSWLRSRIHWQIVTTVREQRHPTDLDWLKYLIRAEWLLVRRYLFRAKYRQAKVPTTGASLSAKVIPVPLTKNSRPRLEDAELMSRNRP